MENFHSNFIDEAHRNKFLPFSKDLSKNYWLDKELGDFSLVFSVFQPTILSLILNHFKDNILNTNHHQIELLIPSFLYQHLLCTHVYTRTALCSVPWLWTLNQQALDHCHWLHRRSPGPAIIRSPVHRLTNTQACSMCFCWKTPYFMLLKHHHWTLSHQHRNSCLNKAT